MTVPVRIVALVVSMEQTIPVPVHLDILAKIAQQV